jgi:hypothetical protein
MNISDHNVKLQPAGRNRKQLSLEMYETCNLICIL